MELVLEDEVFMTRVDKYSPSPQEVIKKIENQLKERVKQDTENMEDEDKVYIKMAEEVRKIKHQIINELKKNYSK